MAELVCLPFLSMNYVSLGKMRSSVLKPHNVEKLFTEKWIVTFKKVGSNLYPKCDNKIMTFFLQFHLENKTKKRR